MPSGGSNKGKGKGATWVFENVAHKGDDCLPYPYAKVADGYGQFGFMGRMVRAHVFMCQLAGECSFLPTPVSRDYQSPGKPSHKRLTESRGQPLPETLGMRVHPEVCEWLMGLPVGWTEMLPSRQLEIPTLPQWSRPSGEQSR